MSKSAILLVNLGSPESPTTKDLKPYLEEFLMDERVIDIPKWFEGFNCKRADRSFSFTKKRGEI